MGVLNRKAAAHPCPRCGAAVMRVHRHLPDRMFSLLHPVLRFRCVDPDCAWEGTLTRTGRELTSATARIADISRRRRAAALFAVAVMAVVSVHAAFTALRGETGRSARSGQGSTKIARAAPQWEQVPDGESHDGEELADDDLRKPPDPTPLTLRRGCAWGVPGRNPYEGTVAQALLAARVPVSAVRKIEAMVEKNLVSDHVEISRAGIVTVSGRRKFDGRSFDMAFGRVMCFNTRVNFKPGHVERAPLYEATDDDGRRHVVMIPDVCGNVSVLGDSEDRDVLPDAVHRVPEPATLVMFGGGLALLAWYGRRRRHRADGNDD